MKRVLYNPNCTRSREHTSSLCRTSNNISQSLCKKAMQPTSVYFSANKNEFWLCNGWDTLYSRILTKTGWFFSPGSLINTQWPMVAVSRILPSQRFLWFLSGLIRQTSDYEVRTLTTASIKANKLILCYLVCMVINLFKFLITDALKCLFQLITVRIFFYDQLRCIIIYNLNLKCSNFTTTNLSLRILLAHPLPHKRAVTRGAMEISPSESRDLSAPSRPWPSLPFVLPTFELSKKGINHQF